MHRIVRSLLSASILVFSFGLFSIPAFGGGFLLFEQSVKGLGNAFAGGAAVAEDATTVFFNPAGITRLSGTHIELGAHYVIPSAKFDNDGSTVSPLLGGAPLTGGDGGDAGVAAPVPNFYISHQLSPKWFAGLGISVPFGLETEYAREWVGRYHAVKSAVQTFDINPNLAYRLNRWLSLGAGVSAQYIEADLTNAVDYGSIGALVGAGTAPQSLDGFVKLEANDFSWRWNVGILVEPAETLRFGLAYRSDVDYTLEGDANFKIPGPALPIAVGTGLIDSDAKADIELPGHLSLSAYWLWHDKIALMGDIFWTHWSQLQELFVELDTGTDVVTTLDWNDTFRYALGMTYYHSPAWTFRIGAAYDQTPIPSSHHRTPRIPGQDRIWTTAGVSWQVSNRLGVDLAYAHLFVNTPKIDKDGLGEDITRGALKGEYDASVDIISAQISYRF